MEGWRGGGVEEWKDGSTRSGQGYSLPNETQVAATVPGQDTKLWALTASRLEALPFPLVDGVFARSLLGLSRVHQFAGVQRYIALRKSAGDEEVIGEIGKIIYAGLHTGVVSLRNRSGNVLR
jgi:hypothetical protein